ncbi:MAG: hypothetical protein HYW48_04275 [Deltaproteobacteria bacterium]|nr:hypothetical protein [Deltaproteobacteria bacterium]
MVEVTRRFKKGWMKLRIAEIVKETHDTKTFFFVDDEEGGRAFDYTAGQYLTFRFDELGQRPIARSYTMSSSPCEADYVAVTVKKIQGGQASSYFLDFSKVGDVLRARGPIGRFCYEPDKDKGHLAMVAAGSGVTPFVSMLREYANALGSPGTPQRMTLLVAYRSTQDLISWPVLTKCDKIAGVRLITTLSREQVPGFWSGRIDQALLEKAFAGEYSKTTFMTCGPQEMMDLTATFLREQGVPEAQIKMESYDN